MCIPLWSKAEKEAFRTQHPTKYPVEQAKHNPPKADVKLSLTLFSQRTIPNTRDW